MIYFIQDGLGAIKIGFTNQLLERMQILQVGNSSNLKLLAVMEGNKDRENRLHDSFSFWNIRGEWFQPCQPLLQFIDYIKKASHKWRGFSQVQPT